MLLGGNEMMKNKKSVSVGLSTDLVNTIDGIVPPMKRGQFIEKAVRAYLESQKAELKQQLQGR